MKARVLSTLVLLPIVLAVIILLPPPGTLVLGAIVVALATLEYAALAARGSHAVPTAVMLVSALATCIALGLSRAPVEVPLLAIMVAIGAVTVGLGHPEDDVVRRAAVGLWPAAYIGLPIGAMVSVRDRWGAAVMLLLFFTIIVSDVAQYYGGRTFGRRPLAPSISPKKTLEGAICGFAAGALVLPIAGRTYLPAANPLVLALLGVTLVALGIVGDLFESLLKRSAGVKDASALIPGHGGMLDRIDALLFAAPVYYVYLRYTM